MGHDHLRAGQRRRHRPDPGGRHAARRASRSCPDASYGVTGDKHFGSGSGITDRMMTTAVPEGEAGPTIFVLDVRDRPWDGTAGLRLIAEWDGMGMAATQSHAMRLERRAGGAAGVGRPARPDRPGRRPAHLRAVHRRDPRRARRGRRHSPARQIGARGRTSCGPTSRWSGRGPSRTTGWRCRPTRAPLRAVEPAATRASPSTPRCGPRRRWPSWPRTTLLRLTRVLGGGTFSRRSPFAHWFEDVRALGFLRPPWGLAYDPLFATSTEPSPPT